MCKVEINIAASKNKNHGNYAKNNNLNGTFNSMCKNKEQQRKN